MINPYGAGPCTTSFTILARITDLNPFGIFCDKRSRYNCGDRKVYRQELTCYAFNDSSVYLIESWSTNYIMSDWLTIEGMDVFRTKPHARTFHQKHDDDYQAALLRHPQIVQKANARSFGFVTQLMCVVCVAIDVRSHVSRIRHTMRYPRPRSRYYTHCLRPDKPQPMPPPKSQQPKFK